MTRSFGGTRLSPSGRSHAARVAAEIDAELRSLPSANTPGERAVRRAWSSRLRHQSGALVYAVGRRLRYQCGLRFVSYELIAHHPDAYRLLTEARLVSLGCGLDSWHAVDSFARILAGPAWRDGFIADLSILKWARSSDRWWRRAALGSTVALNLRFPHG